LLYNCFKEGDAMRKFAKGTGGRRAASPLMVRLDAKSKASLSQAAAMRGISISDYVREVTVAQARREVAAAREQVISLSPDEQLAFWKALHEPVILTDAQRRLGRMIRGEE
jgi:uncharacterized protein (DUF1778 family)